MGVQQIHTCPFRSRTTRLRKLVERGRLVSDVVRKRDGQRKEARSPLAASERKPGGPVSPSAERRAEQTRRVRCSRPVTRGETQCCIVALDGPLTQVSECIRTRDTGVYISPRVWFFLASFASFSYTNVFSISIARLKKIVSFRIERKIAIAKNCSAHI